MQVIVVSSECKTHWHDNPRDYLLEFVQTTLEGFSLSLKTDFTGPRCRSIFPVDGYRALEMQIPQ